MAWRSELQRNFNSAKSTRLPQNFQPAIGTAETVNKGSRDILRGIARNLENNSDIAESVVLAFERNVIGSGLTLQVKTKDEEFNKTIEALFKEWSKPSNCEVSGGLSFLDVQNIIMRRLIVDGGVFVKKVSTKGSKFPFILQLVEVDELDKSVILTNNTSRCFDGIEVDMQNKPIRYHLKKYDAFGVAVSSEPVLAKDIIFLRRIRRPSQIRELSEISRASDRIASTDEYLDSVSAKERVAACFAAFITKTIPSNNGIGRGNTAATSPDGTTPLKNITPGMIQYLRPGENAFMLDPKGQASDTETFLRSEQRLLSAGMGLSYETVARDLSQVNYSSARQNLLEDKETYKGWQRFIIDHFCEEVFAEFINMLILKGLIKSPQEDVPHEWVGSGWSWIDPLKEAKADEVALASNLSTLQRICAEKGVDWKDVLIQRQKEKEFMEEIGLLVPECSNLSPKENGSIPKAVDAIDEAIAKVSLNGAQIQSLLLIVTSVVDNKLDYDAAVELIIQSFPFSIETAKIILGNPKKLEGEETTTLQAETEEAENAEPTE